SPTLLHVDEPPGAQRPHGFADDRAADAEATSEVLLVRKIVAGPVVTTDDRAGDAVGDLVAELARKHGLIHRHQSAGRSYDDTISQPPGEGVVKPCGGYFAHPQHVPTSRAST